MALVEGPNLLAHIPPAVLSGGPEGDPTSGIRHSDSVLIAVQPDAAVAADRRDEIGREICDLRKLIGEGPSAGLVVLARHFHVQGLLGALKVVDVLALVGSALGGLRWRSSRCAEPRP